MDGYPKQTQRTGNIMQTLQEISFEEHLNDNII